MGSGAGTVIGHHATPPRDVICFFNYVTRLPRPTPVRQQRGGGGVIRAAAAPDVRETVQMFPGHRPCRRAGVAEARRNPAGWRGSGGRLCTPRSPRTPKPRTRPGSGCDSDSSHAWVPASAPQPSPHSVPSWTGPWGGSAWPGSPFPVQNSPGGCPASREVQVRSGGAALTGLPGAFDARNGNTESSLAPRREEPGATRGPRGPAPAPVPHPQPLAAPAPHPPVRPGGTGGAAAPPGGSEAALPGAAPPLRWARGSGRP